MKPIHRLWLGPSPMPEEFRFYGAEWERLNPSYKVCDWSWHNLPITFQNADVLEDLRNRCTSGSSVELATALADVISYELVLRHGGIYTNCDIQPVRSIEILVEKLGSTPWASYEDSRYVVNAIFGCSEPNNEFWNIVVQSLPFRYFLLKNQGILEMNQMTGPHLLTKLHEENPGMLHVFPRETFNPIHFHTIPLGCDASGLWSLESMPVTTYGIHHWYHRKVQRSNVVS